MPLSAEGADARSWAHWIRLALIQLGIAGSQGLVSTALREPAGVARVRHRLLAEIAAGPRRGTVTLQIAESPEFIMFAHYQRGASVWLHELVERGIIAALPPPPARRFEAAMLRHAGVDLAPRQRRTIDLAGEPVSVHTDSG